MLEACDCPKILSVYFDLFDDAAGVVCHQLDLLDTVEALSRRSTKFATAFWAPTVGAKHGTLTSRAVTLVHPNGFFGKKLSRVQHTLRNILI